MKSVRNARLSSEVDNIMKVVPQVFESLGLDDTETRVYLALLEFGAQSVGALSKKLGLARSSLYGILRRLVEIELVVESLRQNVSVFSAEPPERLRLLFRRKREELLGQESALEKLIPTLRRKQGGKLLRPRVQVFEGAEGLKAVLKDMLLYSDRQTFAMWPIVSMLEILSADFFRYLNKERIRNRLFTRAIWPKQQVVDLKEHPYLGVGDDFLREIRLAPKGVDFSMGYWSYANKVAFISSRAESMGFVVESEELVQTLLSQFDVVWNLSTPLKVDRSITQAFLKELTLY